jgi:hypothetical protein
MSQKREQGTRREVVDCAVGCYISSSVGSEDEATVAHVDVVGSAPPLSKLAAGAASNVVGFGAIVSEKLGPCGERVFREIYIV